MDEDIEISDNDRVEEEDDGEELKNMSLMPVGLLFLCGSQRRES